MNKVLVTGAAGFIGRHVTEALRQAGNDVQELTSADGDIADEDTWRKAEASNVVVHLAGKSFVPDSWTDPVGCVQTNVMGTLRALAFCRRCRGRLVYVSSYLYGEAPRIPVDETAPLIVTNPYALSKKLAEDACRFFAEAYAVQVVVLRLFNVYGPGQADRFLIPSIIRQVETADSILVKDLHPKRDYVFVGDVATAVVKAATSQMAFRVFNIGFGTSHSVQNVIALVQEIWQTDLPVCSEQDTRPGELQNTVADVRNAGLYLGWQPTVPLREGLLTIHLQRDRNRQL